MREKTVVPGTSVASPRWGTHFRLLARGLVGEAHEPARAIKEASPQVCALDHTWSYLVPRSLCPRCGSLYHGMGSQRRNEVARKLNDLGFKPSLV